MFSRNKIRDNKITIPLKYRDNRDLSNPAPASSYTKEHIPLSIFHGDSSKEMPRTDKYKGLSNREMADKTLRNAKRTLNIERPIKKVNNFSSGMEALQ